MAAVVAVHVLGKLRRISALQFKSRRRSGRSLFKQTNATFHRNSPKVGVDAHNCTPVGSGHTHVEGNCSACPSPCAASVQVDPSPQCEGLFQLFDVDRSGQIDVREFMISLTNFAGASKDDKLKFAFMIFDEDGNGVITKQEVSFSSLITKQEAGLESFLRYHGSDRDLIHSWTRISLSWSSDDEPSPRFPPQTRTTATQSSIVVLPVFRFTGVVLHLDLPPRTVLSLPYIVPIARNAVPTRREKTPELC